MLNLTESSEANSSAGTVAELNAHINECLRDGDAAGALPLLGELCKLEPASAQAHFIAGMTALQLERYEDAREFLRIVIELDPDRADALYNLSLIEMIQRNPTGAREYLRRLLELQPEDSSLRNDLGVFWQQAGRDGRALACFRRALRLNPNNSRARNNALELCLDRGLLASADSILRFNQRQAGLNDVARAEIHRWHQILENGEPTPASALASAPDKRRLVVFANHRTFIESIMSRLSDRYEIDYFEGGTVADMDEALGGADLAWFEWCDDLVIQASRLAKRCPIVCRLHSYEAFTDMPDRVDWTKIDLLLFVNESVQSLVAGRVPEFVNQAVVHNGVDLDKFQLPTQKARSRKIASVGYINYKKNPSLLLYCFKKIHAHDPRYTLHIAGEHQDPRIKLYFDNFLQRHPLPVHFDGWIDDMPSWYADKGWVMSTSLFESFHYSIAEGMASGLIPLIHDWYGAERLYPKEYLFSDPDECLGLLKKLEGADHGRLLSANREYIRKRYDQTEKIKQHQACLAGLTQGQSAKKELGT